MADAIQKGIGVSDNIPIPQSPFDTPARNAYWVGELMDISAKYTYAFPEVPKYKALVIGIYAMIFYKVRSVLKWVQFWN